MRLKILLAATLLIPAAAMAQEDTPVVVVTGSSAPPTSSFLPTKGMSKASVARTYGPPTVKHAAVGGSSRYQPPITRWDYGDYSVFFEYDHVVDAVEKEHPAPVQVRDGLQRDRKSVV